MMNMALWLGGAIYTNTGSAYTLRPDVRNYQINSGVGIDVNLPDDLLLAEIYGGSGVEFMVYNQSGNSLTFKDVNGTTVHGPVSASKHYTLTLVAADGAGGVWDVGEWTA